MEQKIVMKVQMHCLKCRAKALKQVANADGVSLVGIEGAENDKIVVVGDGIDAVKLVASLRNKVGHTNLIAVSESKRSKSTERLFVSRQTSRESDEKIPCY